MKVVRIIARLNVGGPARHVTLLAERLAAYGAETLLVFGSVGPHEASLERLADPRRIRFVKVPSLARSISPLDDLRTLVTLIRIMYREQPDVVHTHTAKAGFLGRIAAAVYNATRTRPRRALVVHTFHGHVLSGYFGRAGSWLVRMTERVLGAMSDAIVTVSAQQREDLVRLFRVAPAAKVHVIELGLDLAPLLSLPVPEPRGIVKFGFVGRLVPVKNPDLLIRAFALASARTPILRLKVVGDGELKGILQREVAALGLNDRVEFTGWQEDLTTVYSDLDAVVLTSINEGTPVAIIEALAAARPVVSTDVGGVRDVVTSDIGILVPSGDREALARAFERLASAPDLRQQLGVRGREVVRRRFTPDRLASDVAALYRHAAAQRSTGHSHPPRQVTGA